MASNLTNIKFFTPERGWLVHPELRSRMIADAEEKKTNLGDLAVQILCRRFGVQYVPNGRRSTPRPDSNQFNFRMPPDLERVIGSVYPGKAMADGIRLNLCAHYGLRVPVKPPMTPRARA